MNYFISVSTDINRYLIIREKCRQQFGSEYDKWESYFVDSSTAKFYFSEEQYLNWFILANLNL